MQGLRCEERVAAFGVGCSINESRHLCPADSAGAHDAGFDGDIEGTVGEVLAAQCLRGCRDSLYLGMCGNVLEGLGEVMSPSYYLPLADDDASDRYFVALPSLFGFGEGEGHIFFIFGHRQRELAEEGELFGVVLEVVTDDDYVGTGAESGFHSVGCGDAAADDKGDREDAADGTYYVDGYRCFGT